jgi:16S rRNA G1207 methylase RsmC
MKQFTKPNEKLPGKELLLKYPVPSNDGCINESTEFIEIPLFVDMHAGIGGDIWPAANLFCNMLTRSHDFYQKFDKIFAGKTILELGSGNGLISILLEKLFPSINSIAVSDIDAHLPLIQHNLDLNHCHRCSCEDVNWLDYGKGKINEGKQKYDVLLALEW